MTILRTKDMDIAVYVKTMTPEMATELIANQETNRHINKRNVEKLANDILDGEFAFNGVPIILNDEGRLIDGQHRCMACINTDTPIEVLFVKGVRTKSRLTIDVGRQRTIANQFKILGVEHSSAIAFSVKMLLGWDSHQDDIQRLGYFHRKHFEGYSANAVYNYYMDNKDEIDPVVEYICRDKACRSIGTTGLIASKVILDRINKKLSDNFFHKIASGCDLRYNSILYHGHNFLKNKENSGTVRNDSIRRMNAVFYFWNRQFETQILLRISPKLYKFHFPKNLVSGLE